MEITLVVTTAVSIVTAAIMGAIAWRLAREERRRSEARVAALAAELHEVDLELQPSRVAPPVEFFRLEPAGHTPSRLATVLAVGVFVVATALAVIVAIGRDGEPLAARVVPEIARPAAPAERAVGDHVPLELVALGHDRDGDRITVRGVVRNPSVGDGRDQLAVGVMLFNRDGGFLGTETAALDAPALAPGSESTFAVTMATATEVGRYRVSFRSRDQIVPHVDRRDPGRVAPVK